MQASQRPGRPDGALYLTTYARLHQYLLAFAQGHLNLLILVGQAGIAKSRTVREVLGNGAFWIEGQRHALRHVREALPAPWPVRRH